MKIVNMSRRRFLEGVVAGGGLVLGFRWPSAAKAADGGGAAATGIALSPYLRVGPDDVVTVIANHTEMGQGVYTSAAMLVAEELDCDWAKVKVESAPVDPAYNHAVFGIQMTGGSSSTWSEFDRYRQAGATARQMLMEAAAAQWKVAAQACTTAKGEVVSPDGKQRIGYGKLAEDAGKRKVPKAALRPAGSWKLIGKDTKRLDTPDKTNGKAIYGLDVSVPGMLVAVVERPPVFGGKVKGFKADKAKAIPGVKDVVQIDRGVAVVADGFWAAKLGRDMLEVEWDEGPGASLTSADQFAEYANLATQAGKVCKNEGDAAAALGKASRVIEATYDLPYLSHATMEPMNCVADVRADGADVWTGSQFQTMDRMTAAHAAGLPPEKVQLHTTLAGGGFGRRAVADCHMVQEAAQLSAKLKAPVKVVWTREDDVRGGYYRPRAVHTVKAGVDAEGKPSGWQHHIVVQSFLVGTPFEKMMMKDAIDPTAVEGVPDTPYALGPMHAEWNMPTNGVPCLWWRSVGHTHTAFVMETMVDELAKAAGKDPVEFRRQLLTAQPRVRKVLELAAEKAGWSTPPPVGRARGVAVHESFKSIVAHVAEVSLNAQGQPRVHRVVTAIDCGPVVNPDTVRAQMESGIVFGLSATLFGEITFSKGRVVQSNFHDYPMLRMNQMPEVEVHIVPSTDAMGGTGEPGVPPVAPAVANALAALTGERVRKLPIRHVRTGGS